MNLDLKPLYKIAFWTSLLGLLIFIFDFGFVQDVFTQELLSNFYLIAIGSSLIATLARYFNNKKLFKRNSFLFDVIFIVLGSIIMYIFLYKGQWFSNFPFIYHPVLLKVMVFISFVREFSEIRLTYKRTKLDPSQLFVLSFLFIILSGALLLMLPKATHQGLTFIDALFTSASAVCVTGLAVVDTGTYFTFYGQVIIMFLIQVGGLGILTFASYFAYFFKGGASYENQLVLSDLASSNKIGEVFSILKYIILITFGIEMVSFMLIYSSLDSDLFNGSGEELFFAAFHAVSAFCNAGFSTLSNSLYEDGFKFNYYLQSIIAFTFIFGGLGFPIVSNVLNYLKYRLKKLFSFGRNKVDYQPWVLSLNSRITLVTTASITAIAFLLFYVMEYNNTLNEHNFFGKMIVAFFSAATPRTAGFNAIDTSSMLFPTSVMVTILMWIGASPSSTGGGIKTSTFAIAILNIISLAKGKSRIEVFKREIADISVKRAFATITLSLMVVGFAIMLISVFDSEKDLLSIAFECFSAYSTSGLSLGITADLSNASKLVIIAVMFVGRVSMLSILIALISNVKHKNYRYPTEEITIT